MTDELEEIGPIDFVLIEFSQRVSDDAADALFSLVERGIITVYDLIAIRKEEDGSVVGLEITLDPFARADASDCTGLRLHAVGTAAKLEPLF